MPSFSISRFIILLRLLWISAEFLLLSTGPILDNTRSEPKTKPQPSEAVVVWKGGAAKWVRSDYKKSRSKRYTACFDVEYTIKNDFSSNPLRHNDLGRKTDVGVGKAAALLFARIGFC